jgi:hypothetical protein
MRPEITISGICVVRVQTLRKNSLEFPELCCYPSEEEF